MEITQSIPSVLNGFLQEFNKESLNSYSYPFPVEIEQEWKC